MVVSQASRETLVCSVISNWTGLSSFVTIVARSRTFAPEQTSSKRSLTESHARSLPSIAKKSARSRHLREISSRTRIDQTCLGWSGFFERRAIPYSKVVTVFLPTRVSMTISPPSHPIALHGHPGHAYRAKLIGSILRE
jgi:hypothetical protein